VTFRRLSSREPGEGFQTLRLVPENRVLLFLRLAMQVACEQLAENKRKTDR
jgi:hypothetical protein